MGEEHVGEERQSEFGSGVVVCLAKFSEHLRDHEPGDLQSVTDREIELERRVRKDVLGARANPNEDLRRAAYASKVELWANAASDHFYELDRDRAPACLVELAELTLKMGHGFTATIWSPDDMCRVRRLWRESCLAVDAMLGIEADWGRW